MPKKLQGTYYRTVIDDNDEIDDTFWELQVQKKSVRLNKIGDDLDTIDLNNVSFRKISDNSYIIKESNQYLKMVRVATDKVDISLDTFDDQVHAIATERMQTFSKTKPTGYFGIKTQDLLRHEYTSDRAINQYYSFNSSPMNNHLHQIDSQGVIKSLESYKFLVIKNYGYVLRNSYQDKVATFIPISKTQLKQKETGEIFTLYPQSDISLEQTIRQKLGLNSEQINVRLTEDTTKKATVEQKTYDFADDQDDDYYDTYDDFGLNEGD